MARKTEIVWQKSISADQWDIARLPTQAGGLYLPHIPSLAIIARTAALATTPTAVRATACRQNLLQEERAELFSRLRGFCHTEPSALAGNRDDPPQGMSLRHLSRKLTHSRDSAAINALWLTPRSSQTCLALQSPGDNPARPATYHGHGDWLHALPGKWETTILNPARAFWQKSKIQKIKKCPKIKSSKNQKIKKYKNKSKKHFSKIRHCVDENTT